MAEKTTVFGRVAIGQGSDAVGVMTFTAEFLRFLFPGHFMKLVVNFVVGQSGSGLFRGVPEKKEQAAAENNKDNVVYQGVFSFWGFRQFIVLLRVLFLCNYSTAPHLRTIRLTRICIYSSSACLYTSGALLNSYT
jgi:hypothetical protein